MSAHRSLKRKIEKEFAIDTTKASKVRKAFNRDLRFQLSIGDYIRIDENTVGEFRGISTFRDPSTITITYYKVEGVSPSDNGVRVLPKEFVYGRRIPIIFTQRSRPQVPESRYQ